MASDETKLTMVKRPLVPLGTTAQLLADLCARVDADEDLTPVFLQLFSDAEISQKRGIDDAKAFATDLKALIAGSKAARDGWAERAKKLDAALEKLKEEAKNALEAHPDLPWQDSFGRQLTLAKNSASALKYSFVIKDSRTFTNIVDLQTVQFFDIPARYLNHVTFTTLDSAAIKADLEAGVELSWVKIERGHHVRGLFHTRDHSLGEGDAFG